MILLAYRQFHYDIDSYVKEDIFLIHFMKRILILLLLITIGDHIIQMKTTTDYKDFDRFSVYDDVWMQMNNRAKWPVTNIVALQTDTKWYDTNFKTPISMNGLTSGTIIVPAAQGWFKIQANMKKGYFDVSCFYSLHFRSTLLYK